MVKLMLATVAFLVMCQSFAQDLEPAMARAIADLVDAKQMEKKPLYMADQTTREAINKITDAFYAAQEKRGNFSEGQKKRAIALMEKYEPLMESEANRVYAPLGARGFMIRWASFTYPHHFTVDEIRQLVQFFASPAYAKIRANEEERRLESFRMAEDPQTYRRAVDIALTQSETEMVNAFWSSTAGQKQKRFEARVESSVWDFWHGRYDSELEHRLAPYAHQMEAEFRSGAVR